MLENINNSNKVLFILVVDFYKFYKFYTVYTAYIVLKKCSVECRFTQVLKRGRLNALNKYNEMV
jgi:hypothetical protein